MTSQAPSILSAEPQLFIADMEAAISFYVRRLGFELAFSHGDPPFYAQVARVGARLNLRLVHGRVLDGGVRASEPDTLSATITTDDAESLFQEFQAADVPFHQTLRTEPWRARTFIVQDPDGNLILFAS